MGSNSPLAPMSKLRSRQSKKWRTYAPDVLPLFVAEMDVTLARPISETLRNAIALSDTGYPTSGDDLARAFSAFTNRRWNWSVDPDQVSTAPDISVAMVETLRALVKPGTLIAVSSPIYPPFFSWVAEAGCRIIDAPLARQNHSWSLDLAAIEATFQRGAKAYLLCNPHNPVGRAHRAEELRSLAELATRYGARVISDEIHAPLTLPGAQFVPFLSVSNHARRCGVALASASKAWNLAGLKCAMIVTAHPETGQLHQRLPEELPWRTGHLGVLASTSAFAEGEAWLDEILHLLDANRRLLATELATHLPEVGFDLPEASYLAWLDVRALGWGDDPVNDLVARARVALSPGAAFGPSGAGFVRLNYGCHPETLIEAVRRLTEYHRTSRARS